MPPLSALSTVAGAPVLGGGHGAPSVAPSTPAPTGFCTLEDLRHYFGDVAWDWPGHIAIGHVTLIAGETGVGKSWLAAYLIAAHLGRVPWPDGTASSGGVGACCF